MVIRRNAAEFLAQLLRSMRLTLARDTRKANSYQSISLKEDDEIILLSDKELPWGNRKIVISDEFKDRKEEVLEFLKLIFLNK